MRAGGEMGRGSCGRGSLTLTDRLRSEISSFLRLPHIVGSLIDVVG